jgi:hypothetical protein
MVPNPVVAVVARLGTESVAVRSASIRGAGMPRAANRIRDDDACDTRDGLRVAYRWRHRADLLVLKEVDAVEPSDRTHQTPSCCRSAQTLRRRAASDRRSSEYGRVLSYERYVEPLALGVCTVLSVEYAPVGRETHSGIFDQERAGNIRCWRGHRCDVDELWFSSSSPSPY